jgi:histidine decarboxylase
VGRSPSDVYPSIPHLDSSLFQLSETGLSEQQYRAAWSQFNRYILKHRKYFMGYQANQQLDYRNTLSPYLNLHVNNIGDPFQQGNFMLNSKILERAVLDYFARLWHADWPHLEDRTRFTPEEIGESYWGYIVSMGGTEGNLYGLRNARDYLAGKLLASDIPADAAETEERVVPVRSKLGQGYFVKAEDEGRLYAERDARAPETERFDNPNAYTPVIFYSQDTHYSIDKIKDLLLIPTFAEIGNARYPNQSPLGGNWPDKVPSNEDGSVNLDALYLLAEFFVQRGYPIIVNFNYGTTFKGAYDNVKAAVERLIPLLQKHGLYHRVLEVEWNGKIIHSKRTGFWFHVDGALGASYTPFLELARQQGRFKGDIPVFDFRLDIQSIAASGHKEIGAPWPCGIYMTRTKYLLDFLEVGYIGAQDSTLSGSRNGFSALILWDYFARHSYDALIEKALRLEKLADYAYRKLKQLEGELGFNLHVGRSPLALTVRFRRPNARIVSQFSLSTEFLNGVYYAHIFLMEHVTTQLVDTLIQALRQPGAFGPDADQGFHLHEGSGFR